MDENKRFLTEFMDCYKSCRSLWDITIPEYRSRHGRFLEYSQLLEVMKKYKQDSTLDDVKKRINTLRSNFNRELNKLRISEENGDKPVYKSTLWYFNKLKFLKSIRETRENIKESAELEKQDEIYFDEVMLYENNADVEVDGGDGDGDRSGDGIEEDEVGDDDRIEEEEEEVKHEDIKVDKIKCKRFASKSFYQPAAKVLKKHKKMRIANNSRSLPPPPPSLPQPASSTDGDTIDHLCKAWAGKLREMNKHQRLIAERAISEIIFQGQIEVLTFDSVPKMPAVRCSEVSEDYEPNVNNFSSTSTTTQCNEQPRDNQLRRSSSNCILQKAIEQSLSISTVPEEEFSRTKYFN